MHMYSWFTLQYITNEYNIVKQLYPNKNWRKKKKEEWKMCIQYMFEDVISRLPLYIINLYKEEIHSGAQKQFLSLTESQGGWAAI